MASESLHRRLRARRVRVALDDLIMATTAGIYMDQVDDEIMDEVARVRSLIYRIYKRGDR